jgi:protein TonB
MLLDELARQREAAPPVRDRLTTTLFLVGALHALVILGVTFAPPRGGGGADAPSLAVLLVHDPIATPEPNPNADYLAQVNQRGAGTALDVRGAEAPHGQPALPGGEAGEGADPRAGTTADEAEDLVASRAAARQRHRFGHAAAAGGAGTVLELEPLSPEAVGLDAGAALSLRGRPERELLVVANTRESSVAVYLDAWRRKIERIGTLNYPLDAVRHAGLSGNPVLEVRIMADGQLGGAVVRRSSGHPQLDHAALEILRLAAPFDPFPRTLAARHDALRLIYEWQFLGGELQDSTVRMPADTR